MRRILIMGAGGVGSNLVRFLSEGIRLDIVRDVEMTIADPDLVEHKNLLYSWFDVEDVGANKAEVLAAKVHAKCVKKRIGQPEELQGYDLVICCTDDGKSRKLVYEHARNWIDMRAKGGGYAIYVKNDVKNPMEKMLGTIDLDRAPGSCQYESRVKRKEIDSGNLIAAAIGYQVLLNYLREELSVFEFIGHV